MASAVNPETDRQREDRATKLAYEKGRRDAEVDGRLAGHDQHLAVINGFPIGQARIVYPLFQRLDFGPYPQTYPLLDGTARDEVKLPPTRNPVITGIYGGFWDVMGCLDPIGRVRR